MTYEDNVKSLGLVVQKMSSLDEDVAIDIWSFLLSKYKARIKESDSYAITGEIIYQIGTNRTESIISQSPVIKEALFSHSYHVSMQSFFIGDLITKNELQLADELLELLYNNSYKEDTWYEIMDHVMPRYDSKITSEAYELFEIWCDKVENKEERAKLSIKMLAFID